MDVNLRYTTNGINFCGTAGEMGHYKIWPVRYISRRREEGSLHLEEEGIFKRKRMLPLKAFFILSILLCGLIIQPSMAARDLAHDTQTKVAAEKSVNAAALKDKDVKISTEPSEPGRSSKPISKDKPYVKPVPSGRPYVPSPCRNSYRCRPPSP